MKKDVVYAKRVTMCLSQQAQETLHLQHGNRGINSERSITMPFPFWTVGCVYGASAVAMGAFGAHGLKKKIADPARIANWNTAAHYQV